MNKVYICCPGNAITGGPELLHQFVDTLRNMNVDASILYYPFDINYKQPDNYAHYNIKISNFNDIDTTNSVVIVPEVATRYIRFFTKATVCVWWLSLDNYFPAHPDLWSSKIRYIISIIRKTRYPIYKMRKLINITQSEYARLYLEHRGISAITVTDYLNDAHLNTNFDNSTKKNVIVYNPKKGIEITQQLISKNKDFNFIAIENMTPKQVGDLFKESKLYIDFGSHPGKDRLPREAAIAGCCIITGRKGSAANEYDVPIPTRFKLDDHIEIDNDSFRKIVNEIFSGFEEQSKLFISYREKIKNEPTCFKRQVAKFVEKYL
ncbi:hypothetical protein IW01_19525 [Pectobacterium brasiliense]|uniref:hypothetical protein n=1 Tax=Pectobacterium brasiliense TaxID=180957 RepID=UPI0004E6A15C|nr:hypothetical protein [Pectobacterium brasiliense]KFF63528.1 hypothetical protein IW01_19525 [Pectobacterium brasiliense]